MSAAPEVVKPGFEQGLEERRLLIQRCSSCGTMRHPPSPFCGKCRSWEAHFEASGGTGTLHSFTIVERAAYPGAPVPHVIGLVDLDEAVRVLAPLRIDGEPRIGMRVSALFERQPPATINLVFEEAEL